MNDPRTDVRSYVAAEVRAELARRRMSLRQASDRLGWKLTATHRRITGESPLDAGHLHELSEMLDVPVEQFFPPRRHTSGRQGMNALYLGRALAA